jgi:Tfp pilus assembly major pilin PilA
MRTYGKQKGITLMGFAMLLGILGFFAYMAMKLVPVYLENFNVVKSMKAMQTVNGIEQMPIDQIRNQIDAIFSVQYVDEKNVPLTSLNLITANGQHSLHIAYDRDIPFLYNIDFLVHFEHSVDLAHGATY